MEGFCRRSATSLTKFIVAIHNGQIWADSSQLNAVLTAFADAVPLRAGSPKRRNPLTKCETEVTKLVVAGLTNREVGHELHLTELSVSNHLLKIYEKLGISSRVELILHFLER